MPQNATTDDVAEFWLKSKDVFTVRDMTNEFVENYLDRTAGYDNARSEYEKKFFRTLKKSLI